MIHTDTKHPDYQKFNSGAYKDFNCAKCGARVSSRDIDAEICSLCSKSTDEQRAEEAE